MFNPNKIPLLLRSKAEITRNNKNLDISRRRKCNRPSSPKVKSKAKIENIFYMKDPNSLLMNSFREQKKEDICNSKRISKLSGNYKYLMISPTTPSQLKLKLKLKTPNSSRNDYCGSNSSSQKVKSKPSVPINEGKKKLSNSKPRISYYFPPILVHSPSEKDEKASISFPKSQVKTEPTSYIQDSKRIMITRNNSPIRRFSEEEEIEEFIHFTRKLFSKLKFN